MTITIQLPPYFKIKLPTIVKLRKLAGTRKNVTGFLTEALHTQLDDLGISCRGVDFNTAVQLCNNNKYALMVLIFANTTPRIERYWRDAVSGGCYQYKDKSYQFIGYLKRAELKRLIKLNGEYID